MIDPVIVVGAGPVGLVTALRLARWGIPVELLEQEAAPARDLRASTFHPPTLEMLDEFAITPELIRRGNITPKWQLRFHPRGDVAEFDLGLIADATRYPFRLQCEQAHLCDIALDLLRREPTATVRMGARVAGFTQDQEGVRVRVDGGERRGSFLIGCDGAHSVVRRVLDLPFTGKTYPETIVLVVTSYDFRDAIPDLAGVAYCWIDGGNFALLRLRDRWRASFYPPVNMPIETALSEPVIEAFLQSIVPRPTRYEVLQKGPYRVHQRVADTYRVGRVMIAGDAAHLNNPSGGMGMNSGVHDAFNLTDKLRQVLGGAGMDLLDRYTAERQPVAVEHVQAQSDRNRNRMRETDPEKRLTIMRDMRALAADPARARAFLLKTSMLDQAR